MSIINIQKLIDLISTAKAIYGNLLNASTDNLKAILTDVNDEANFADVEAEAFIARYEIAAPFESTVSGLQSIIFYDKIEHKHVLAIRGSEQVLEDFILADGLLGIGPNGVANHQAVDLYRYWKKATTTLGEPVVYTDEEIQKLIALFNGTTFWSDIDTESLVFQSYAAGFRSDVGLSIGDHRLYSSTVVDVTGHSLGGNLVYGFASMFPENIGEAVTINAPGLNRFIGNGQDLLSGIGFTIVDDSKVTSINAEGDWVHLVSGSQPGSIVPITQEVGHDYLTAFDGVNNNHSVINGLDSLNIMNLFAKMDPTLANSPSGILQLMIWISSNVKENTYENIIDGLRRTLYGENLTNPLPVATKADLVGRNEMYEAMDGISKLLVEGGALHHLVGKISISIPSKDITIAQKNYGEFLALYLETPFVLRGSNSDLSALNMELYDLWEHDLNLTSTERATGKANFSNEWYQDKIQFLNLLHQRNNQDIDSNASIRDQALPVIYLNMAGDLTNSKRLLAGLEGEEADENYSNTDKVIFGNLKDNSGANSGVGSYSFSGANGNDRIYGMGGNDYLVGNKGNDLLDGGADNDTLTGGEGHDTLKGGAGNDTYIFDTNFSKDQIIDADGAGSIVINGVTLSTVKLVEGADIIYRDSVDNPKFEIIKINNGNSVDLLISALGSSGGQILVKNWSHESGKNLGITLDDSVSTSAFTPETISGNNNNNALSVYNLRDADPTKNITAVEATEINGGVGNDILMGMADSRDTISGGDDNDIISGGFTSDARFNQLLTGMGQVEKDTISGGGGQDFIFASSNGSVAHGDDDNDVLMGNSFAVFKINELAAFSGESAHGAITRDQIYADIFSYINFSFVIENENTADASDDRVNLSLGYFDDFTTHYQEYTGSHTGINFIAKSDDTPIVSDNGKIKFSYSGKYEITYDFERSNGLMPADTHNQNPVSFQFSQYQFSNAADAESVASYKGVNLYGDKGRDFIMGSVFADYLSGGDDGDFIQADYGHDVLDGGNGDDQLYGQDGDDIMLAGEGNDAAFGGAGKDIIHGGDDDDKLSGEEGNDYLVGGAGKDAFWGGTGDDIIMMDKDDLAAQGGAGNDLFIINDIAYTESHVNQNNSNPNVSPYLVGTQNGQSIYSITINDTEGSNTIALVGSNTSSINAQAQDNDVILTSGDTSIYLVNGLQSSNNNIATGRSAEAIQQNQFTEQLSINDFLVDAISNSVNITAQTANKEIIGGRVNDTLTANIGGSQLRGGKGDDQLNGEIGNDTYIYALNDGNDTITEKGGNNTIKFAANITADMLDLKRVNNQLQIHLSNGQIIRVNNMFENGAIIQANAIQQIQFADGTAWDQTRIHQEIIKPRNFIGTDYSETLIGAEGNDTLTGKKGNDQLQGGLGDDTYQFSATDGKDTITDSQGNDRILFDNTVDENSIIVRRDVQNNLLINIDGNDAITLNNAVNTDGTLNSNSIESIQFANGNLWDIAKLQTEIARGLSITQTGTSANDILKGDNANTIFIGNQGNDHLNGGAANDTYRYALGDGNDVIQDTNGTDKLILTNITDPSSVLVERDGNNLKLTPIDGSTVTINNYFVPKAAVVVDPNITAIIDQLQNRWLAQAEKLIETHYGLTTTAQVHLSFVSNVDSPEAAHIELEYVSGEQKASKITLEIDLSDFANAVNNANGSGPLYFDRIIAHEMVHALMGANMDMTQLPPWFKEGTAELIHGADERVKADLPLMSAGQNFVALFHNATIANPNMSAGYSVSYIAVKLLDKEIRSNGGAGIKNIFDQLKTGKTLDQAFTAVSAAYPGLQSLWTNLSEFENHVKAVGFSQIPSLLNLSDADTGSIAGADYGNAALNAETIVPDASIGSPTHLQLTIPENYIESPELNGTIETIEFANGVLWNQSQVAIEIQNTIDQILKRIFTGTSTNDTITATDGNNQITGLTGNDQLNGLAGNDTYIYNLGDGNDTIVDTAGVDQVRFGAGINADDVRVQRFQTNHLQILLLDGSVITVQNAFDSVGNFTGNAIENIQYSNGVNWSQSDVLLQIQNYLNRPFTGTANADVINATNGNNVITGLAGNDQLNGDAGDDVYVYNLGDGNDKIVDTSGIDAIQFGAGIHANDILIRKYQTNHMQIQLKDGSIITIQNAFNAAGNFTANAIENVKYADGANWSQAEMLFQIQNTLPLSFAGTTGNDVINANRGNNVITGLTGDDQLNDAGGNDTYVYKLGDGNDTIFDVSGTDVIQFGAGIYAADLHVQRYQTNHLKIQLQDGSIIIVQNAFDAAGNFTGNKIENIKFTADNTEWSHHDILALIQIQNTPDYSIVGTNGADILNGTAANNIIIGLAGNDEINGGDGNDVLYGSNGNDKLSGGKGDDIYIHNLGDGNDHVIFGEGKDTLYLNDANIDSTVIRVNRLDDVTPFNTIKYGNVSLTFDLKDSHALDSSIVFSDGTILTQESFRLASIKGTNNPDSIIGWEVDDVINGMDGSDRLRGYNGNDTLISGSGKDSLWGGDGNDILISSTDFIAEAPSWDYNFNQLDGGDGNDIYSIEKGSKFTLIQEYTQDPEDYGYVNWWGDYNWGSGGFDVIEFHDEVTPDNIVVKFSNELINENRHAEVYFYAGNDVVKTRFNMETLSSYEIEEVHFSNGTVWDRNKIIQEMSTGTSGNDFLKFAGFYGGFTINGNAGDDDIYGAYGNDLITGGSGNDYLRGDSGNDTYLFSVDHGNDRIEDSWGNDKIVFDNSVDITSVSVSRVDGLGNPNNKGSDILIHTGANNSIRLQNFFYSTGYYAIETVEFSDGVVWNQNDLESRAFGVYNAKFESNGQVISGKTQPNLTLVIKDSDGSEITSLRSNERGEFTVNLPFELINRESVNLYAKDDAGNISKSLTINAPDLIAPSIPSAVFSSNGAAITGVAEAGSTIVVRNAAGLQIGGAIANLTLGTYSVALNSPLINKQQVSVIAADPSGNQSAEQIIFAPDKVIIKPTASFDSFGRVIAGISEPGSTVTVRNSSYVDIGSALADTITGIYSITLPTALSNNESVNVFAVDAAGNVSAYQVIQAPDSTAPDEPSAIFDATGKVISGIAERGSTITIRDSSQMLIGTAAADLDTGKFTVSFDNSMLNQTVYLFVTDASGNTSNMISITALEQIEDITPPSQPTAIFTTTGKNIYGEAEANSTVIVRDAAGEIIASTVAWDVGWYNVEFESALKNSELISVTAVDSSGNVSQSFEVYAPSASEGLNASYYGYNRADNDGVGLSNLSQVMSVISNTSPDAEFISTFISYGTSVSESGVGFNLWDFLGIDSDSLNATPELHDESIIRFYGNIQLDAGTYRFSVGADDGYCIKIDGVVVANFSDDHVMDWREHQEFSVEAGRHSIEIVYWDTGAENYFEVNLMDENFNYVNLDHKTFHNVTEVHPTSIVIEAENYTSMSGVQNESSSDAGGGQNVGYIEAGDWMAYNNANVNVPTEGRYKITYRVASLNGGGRLSLKDLSSDNVLNSIDVPKTNGWQNWVDVTQEITLDSGNHNFKIAVESGGFNINWFKLERVEPVARVINQDIRVDQLIQAMASFAPAAGIETNVLSGMDDRVNHLIAVGQ